MTAATVPNVPASPLAELILEHPTAYQLANRIEWLEPAQRHAEALDAIQARRAQLVLYVDLVRERYGSAPPLQRVIADDELLGELTILAYA